MEPQAAFFIVKTFARLYHEYAVPYALTHDLYAVPRIDLPPEGRQPQYRGLDRDPLSLMSPHTGGDGAAEGEAFTLVERPFGEGESREQVAATHIASFAAAEAAYARLGAKQSEYEIVWARVADAAVPVPTGFSSLGYEPSYFPGSYFSVLCDCMCFPRWHGTDSAGTLFADYFARFNPAALFDTADAARDFLAFYLSLPWTERGDFAIAEVFIGAQSYHLPHVP